MSNPKKHVNLLLLIIAIGLCFAAGILFTGSSNQISPARKSAAIEIGTADSQSTAEDSVIDTKKESAEENAEDKKNDSEEEGESEEAPAETEEAESTPVVSDAASSGTWTSSGSSWMFMVNGTPYTGWLTDTDGKTYYFNADGIMQTGWIDDSGKRFYLDLDGIMQRNRTVTIDGTAYEFNADGTLKGYEAEVTPTEAPAEATPTPAPTETPAETPVPAATKYVALTFDDGPSDFTGRLLDCLEKNNAKATFFMVGTEIVNHTAEVQRMEALGCELGNHTYDHLDLAGMDAQLMSDQIAGVDETLVSIVGHGATVVRPPYGSIDDTVRSVVGTPMILWSIDTLDWETQDAQQTIDNTLSQVQDGSIVLMHDIFSETVDAAEQLIPELINQGYQLVTVSELASIKGTTLQAGVAYGDFSSAE